MCGAAVMAGKMAQGTDTGAVGRYQQRPPASVPKPQGSAFASNKGGSSTVAQSGRAPSTLRTSATKQGKSTGSSALAVSATLEKAARLRTIPQSFLGFSHEWLNVSECGDRGFKQLITQLGAYGSGPLVLRVGGSSTDLRDRLPSNDTYPSLASLYNELGEMMRGSVWE